MIKVIDADANVVNQYRYTPFGESRVKIETVENPYEYAGRRLDDESGKYYNRARIYSAEQGRFMSADPMGNMAGANRYAYCGNIIWNQIPETGGKSEIFLRDPINHRDPSGMLHDWELAKIDGGGGGYSGGFVSGTLVAVLIKLGVLKGGWGTAIAGIAIGAVCAVAGTCSIYDQKLIFEYIYGVSGAVPAMWCET